MVDSFGGLKQLPIRRRGQFMKDDFFKDFQQDFDSAIQDVMDRYTGRSLLADQFSTYRKLRESSHGTGPAASISETKDATDIVLDMSDFFKGSIAVRTRGRYVIVEAECDSRNFSRKFPLSVNTNFDGVKSAMSNEGILTITAPKKVAGKVSQQPSDSEKQTEVSLKIDIGEPEKLDSTTPTSPSDVADEKEAEEGEPSSPLAEDRVLSISKKGKFFEDQYFEKVWKDFESAIDEMVQKEEKKKKTLKEESRLREKKELADKLKNEMLLEAERKQREFFDKARHRESLSSLGIPKFSRLNSYRNLRTWAPDTGTQAVTITQDAKGYKIVMDVKSCDNGDGDLSVKATEGSLTVSGRRGSLTFKKEFSLNGLTNPDQVNASLSEDGILTVTAAV